MPKRKRSAYRVIPGTVGSEIRAAREARGMTQQQLAEAIGFADKSAVHRMETGERAVSDDLRQSILAYLNAKRDDVPLVRDGVFVITGGRRQNKATVTVFAQTAKTVRTLSRQHGLTSAELLEQMVNFCIERMQQ